MNTTTTGSEDPDEGRTASGPQRACCSAESAVARWAMAQIARLQNREPRTVPPPDEDG